MNEGLDAEPLPRWTPLPGDPKPLRRWLLDRQAEDADACGPALPAPPEEDR